MGQEITTTPLQLLNAFNVFSNGGWLLKPAVVEGVVDSEQNVVQRLQTPERVRHVISEKTAKTMIGVMAKVVTQGTGKAVAGGDYTKFGKPGTAQKAATGGYSHTRFVSSFLCGAPVEEPRITVLVLVDEPGEGRSYYAATVAAPAAGRIVERVLKHLEVPPSVRVEQVRAM